MIMTFDDLLGKPFALDGDNGGYNCYTLSQEVLKRADIGELPPRKAIECLADRHRAIRDGQLEDYTELDKPEPFCIVTFSIRKPYVTHMGVVLQDCKSFIHVMRKRCVCIEKLDDKIWKRKIDGYYRYKGGNGKKPVPPC